MAEKLVIPPVPDDREEKYLWVTEVKALGMTVEAACKLAGITRIGYYKQLHRKSLKQAEGQGDAA